MLHTTSVEKIHLVIRQKLSKERPNIQTRLMRIFVSRSLICDIALMSIHLAIMRSFSTHSFCEELISKLSRYPPEWLFLRPKRPKPVVSEYPTGKIDGTFGSGSGIQNFYDLEIDLHLNQHVFS